MKGGTRCPEERKEGPVMWVHHRLPISKSREVRFNKNVRTAVQASLGKSPHMRRVGRKGTGRLFSERVAGELLGLCKGKTVTP